MNQKWIDFINSEISSEYGLKLQEFIKQERLTKLIYPNPENVFDAFRLCDYYDLKVVILGQDPYHSTMTAHGLAFSSLQGQTPPSLQNIFYEIKNDVFPEFRQSNTNLFKSNNLTCWAQQGVLLLNTILTVEKGLPLSHKNKGWEQFTQNTIKFLNNHPNKIVYMLWGNNAKDYKQYIDTTKHLVLEANHPSPMSANRGGWYGTKHFSQANEFIKKHYWNKKPMINWAVLN
jgi:uracil-DNA glycosylase